MDSPTILQSRNPIPAPVSVNSRIFLSMKALLLTFWPALVATALFLAVMGYEITVIKSHEGGASFTCLMIATATWLPPRIWRGAACGPTTTPTDLSQPSPRSSGR